MGNVSAGRGRFNLIANLIYLDRTLSPPAPFGMLFMEARAETRSSTLSPGAFYREHDEGNLELDLAAGVRSVDAVSTVTLVAGAFPTETVRQKATWVDPIVALRAWLEFNERWFGTLYHDGGRSGSSDTFDAGLGLDYSLNDRRALQTG